MVSTRWRLWALAAILASPAMIGAKEADIRFTNFERPSLEVGSEVEPWEPLITRIVDPIRGAQGSSRPVGGPSHWLGDHFGIFGKPRASQRWQGVVVPVTGRDGLSRR